MATATDFDVRVLATSEPAAAALLNSYAQEIEERFVNRPACRVDTVATEYAAPGGTFLVAYEEGQPVACAGVRALPDGAGEIKRMYVVPDARGRGLARELLGALEDAARALGYTRLRLDTGAKQPHAEALYRSAGYRDIENYNANDYASFWGEKWLGVAASRAPGK
jgi:GNAT superfamily N-acetyltransferase